MNSCNSTLIRLTPKKLALLALIQNELILRFIKLFLPKSVFSNPISLKSEYKNFCPDNQ